MIQFQRTFTNAEQSKRLLELGVPADSADCYISPIGYIGIWQDDYEDKTYRVDYIPCWSIGRLMEIYDTCDAEYMHKGWDTYFDLTIDYIEFVVRMLEFDIPRGKIDLSRLEGEQ